MLQQSAQQKRLQLEYAIDADNRDMLQIIVLAKAKVEDTKEEKEIRINKGGTDPECQRVEANLQPKVQDSKDTAIVADFMDIKGKHAEESWQ